MVYAIGFLLGKMLGGALFGLIPFLIGRKTNPKLARTALLVCAVTALLHAWITLISVIVFTIVILKKPAEKENNNNN